MTTPTDSPHSGCKTFTLTIDMNSAAFEANGLAEVQDILTKLAHRFNRSPDDTGGFVKDSSGGTVGDWEIAQPEPDPRDKFCSLFFCRRPAGHPGPHSSDFPTWNQP